MACEMDSSSSAKPSVASTDPMGMPSRTWSCDTLLRASSFLADQQAQHKGKLTGADALAATWHGKKKHFLEYGVRALPPL